MSSELEMRQNYLNDQSISSIYFGGGTPSMLPPADIQFLIDKVYKLFQMEKEVEITLEANPDNLTRDYLKKLQTTDVNRFSIGIQSFFAKDLEWMNRAHNEDEASMCIEHCIEFGYTNFSIDLIFGVPGSSNKRWKQNLEKAITYRPHHISCYALTVEENTALHHQILKGKSAAPIDKETEEQFLLAHDMLEEAGYNHYEISNYALEGQHSKHNSSYWEGLHYLGIGPAAHSFDGHSRSWNIAHLPKYMEAIKQGKPDLETELLSKDDQYNEWIMTSIRKNSGIDLKVLDQYYRKFRSHFDEALKEIPTAYIKSNNESISLTRQGLLFADFVGSMLFKVEH